MNIEYLISAVQKQLGVRVDGRAGPETWRAIYAHVVSPKIGKLSSAQAMGTVDTRSEKTIATLHAEVQPIARALVQKAAQSGIQIKIISGLRTYDEQEALYAQGRSKPGIRVTNARGGYSNHNFGIAFDVGVFEGAKYMGESLKYKAVGVLGMDLGLEWGGNWKTIVDQPHFQLRPAWAEGMNGRELLAELRERAANNSPIYA